MTVNDISTWVWCTGRVITRVVFTVMAVRVAAIAMVPGWGIGTVAAAAVLSWGTGTVAATVFSWGTGTVAATVVWGCMFTVVVPPLSW